MRKFRNGCAGLLAVLSLFPFAMVCGADAPGKKAHRTNPAAVQISLLPINFEPSQGQTTRRARFLARTGATEIDLYDGGFGLSLAAKDQPPSELSVTFLGASQKVQLNASDHSLSITNYLIGQDPSLWQTHVPNFRRVTYSHLYPGIDAVFYGNGQQLEHDFVVAPGADYRAIHLQVRGDRQMVVDPSGDLRLMLGAGELAFHKPIVYQTTASGRQSRKGQFVLLGSDQVGFTIGDYDHSRPLYIDPVLSYSSYLADLSLYVNGVAADAAGNAYVTGMSFSTNYPVTSGSFQGTCNSCASNRPDVFITKFNSSGTGQVFSTYLGGSSYNQPAALAVDARGNTVIAGYTQSTDFPLKNAISHGYVGATGGTYGFIASLSPDGSSLNFSSILGGGTAQYQGTTTSTNALALDSSGNAYISGATDTSAFPVTTGALNLTSPAYPESVIYVSKFSTAGALVYSALLGDTSIQGGGGGSLGVLGMGIDPAGNAYIAGGTGSLWPTTSGAYEAQFPTTSTSNTAPYVAKISADGSTLLYSTFLGADANVTGLAVDGVGEVFVTGDYAPSTFPTTSNGFLPSIDSGTSAGFLSELNAAGSDLLYSTFLPGAAQPTGVALDASQNIWLVGTTQSREYPLVNPIQSIGNLGGTYSASSGFVSEFDPTGSSLLFSTYFSGQTFLKPIGPAFDGEGKLHIAGTTDQTLYTTPGAYLGSVTPPPPYNQYTYGFIAAIDPGVEAPSLCLAYPANTGISFGWATVGTSQSQTVTVQDCGTAPLTIANVQTSSSAFTIPAGTNSCLATVPVGNACSFSVQFTPTQAQSYTAALTLTSNATIPPTSVPLQGSGAEPQIAVSSNSLTFSSTLVGTTSAAAYLQIGDYSPAPLTVDLVHTAITASFAFTQNGCNVPLGTCYLYVTFTPLAGGTATGTLTIVTNDPVTPSYTVNLSGEGLTAYPVPSISSVNPLTVAMGGSPVQLNVHGQNFFPGSVIKVNGTALSTTYQDDTYVYATLDPSMFTSLAEVPLTVVNPAPGGGESAPVTLTIYRTFPGEFPALVFEPFSQLLYAAIPAGAASNPNSIVSIDPATGTMGTPLAVGADPEALALSDDGLYLYVGVNGLHAIQRINLATMSVEKTFTLPVDSEYGGLGVREMHVVPGSPQTIVAALSRNASPSEEGLAAYNDAGLINWIPNDYPVYLSVDSFAYAGNPSVIYGRACSSPVAFLTVTLDSSGLHYTPPSNTGACGSSSVIASDGTLLYGTGGQVWNPTTQSLVGTYAPSSNMLVNGVIPDNALGRTFYLTQDGSCAAEAYVGLCAFDQNTFSQTGSVDFQYLFTIALSGLSRWGNDGFAFFVNNSSSPGTPGSQIITLRSSIAHVSTGPNPVPGLSALSAPSAAQGGANFLLGITGTNFVRGAVVNWNGNSRTTTYVNSTQLTAYVPRTDIAASTSAQITVTNPAPGGGTSPALTLTIGQLSQVQVNPGSLNFTLQAAGSSSAAQSVMVTNSGTAALYLAVSSSGEFSQTNNCSASLGVGATCTINVTFTPAAGGIRSGSITLLDNAANSPQTVALTGTGGGPAATLAPGILVFSDEPVASTSEAQSVTLANPGNASLSISTITASTNFIENNNCGTTLAASATCTIQVQFKPLQSGSLTGTLTVTDDAGNNPQSIPLSGNGTQKAASLSPNFTCCGPDVLLGRSASLSPVSLMNSGNVTLNVTSIATTGDYAQTNTCGATLAVGAECTLNVTFTPTGEGNRPGSLIVTDDAPGGPQIISVYGVGMAAEVLLSPATLTFGSLPPGSTSAIKTLMVSNTGNYPLTFTSIAASGDFAQTNTCGTSIAADGACVINVTFTPTAGGSRTGTLAITNSAATSPQSVTLTGTGLAAVAGLSPGALTFTQQAVGVTSAAQPATLANTGNATLTITSVATSGDFEQTSNCGATLAAGATCTINVTFTPASSGSRSGTLTVTDSAAGSPHSVLLTGTGAAAVAGLSPGALTFADQAVGVASAAQSVTLANTGNATLTIASVATSGDFEQTNNCGATLAAGATCTINVTFTPASSGSRSGTLTVTDNNNAVAGTTQSATLEGIGTGPTVSLSPTALTFSGQMEGTTSAIQTVTLSNTGNAALAISSVAATGDFAQINTCGSSVATGGNCAISVTFKPTAGGTRSGAITIGDNAPEAPHNVTLSGTGEDFTFAPPTGSSTSATVAAGQPANYTLSVGGQGGLSGTVSFACTGAPSQATCSVSPNPATLGTTATNVTVTVTTTVRGVLAPKTPHLPGRHTWPILLLWLVALWSLSAVALGARPRILTARRRMVLLPLGAGLLLAWCLVACGGGGGSSGGATNPGTPAGTYNLTVTGTEGAGSTAVSHIVSLTLTVN